MADMPLHRLPEPELETALRGLADSIAWPLATPAEGSADIASLVRARLEAGAAGGATARPPAPSAEPGSWRRWTLWPARRALVVAIIILLAVAALVGAAGLGLPGLRLIFGEPPVSPPPSLEPSRSPAAGLPGATLSLGERVELAELDARAGFPVTWPTDPTLGPPDAAYIDKFKGGQVSLVWATRDGLPATLEPGVGMILTAFRGRVDDTYVSKALNSETTVEVVLVDGQRGFWLGGDPHFFFYESPGGGFIEDPRRWVGDTLVWADGLLTYRLETALGRDATIGLAETMP
jgi:hypothetical protein